MDYLKFANTSEEVITKPYEEDVKARVKELMLKKGKSEPERLELKKLLDKNKAGK